MISLVQVLLTPPSPWMCPITQMNEKVNEEALESRVPLNPSSTTFSKRIPLLLLFNIV